MFDSQETRGLAWPLKKKKTSQEAQTIVVQQTNEAINPRSFRALQEESLSLAGEHCLRQ